jgi:hypothetical protein
MNIQHLQPAGMAGPCVDCIDVVQLLRDLGEASAACSAVDLFGLCLSAQRVLAKIHATGIHAETALQRATAPHLCGHGAIMPAAADQRTNEHPRRS